MGFLEKKAIHLIIGNFESMVSLIITVRNEHETLPQWFESIKKQTRQPDEIVIVDGGSSDATWEWLQKTAIPSVRVYLEVGNISRGRNFAIGRAHGEIIVVTDAGCVYDKSWLENMVNPVINGTAEFIASAFGPWLKPDDSLLTFGIASATVPHLEEFHNKTWFASSRSVAFKKEVWEKVGGYPEGVP